jgi:hypothetical protein
MRSLSNNPSKERELMEQTLEEMIEEQKASHERIWQIVNKLTYEEFKAMQRMLAPIEDEDA